MRKPGKRNRLIIMVLLAGSCTLPVAAQGLSSLASIDSVTRFEAIPSDLTFEMLELSGFHVQQPGTLSKLLVSLGTVVDRAGRLNPGVAVSFAPYQLIKSEGLQLNDYVSNFGTRLLANSQLSLGTASSRSADSTQDWGIGLRIVFLNTGDGRLDTNYLNLLFKHGQTLLNIVPEGSDSANASAKFRQLQRRAREVVKELNNAIDPAMDARQLGEASRPYLGALTSIADTMRTMGFNQEAESLLRNIGDAPGVIQLSMAKMKIRSGERSSAWNTTSLDLSIGTVYQSSSASVLKSDFRRVKAWLNGGFGFGDSQLLLQAGVLLDRSPAGGKDSTSAIGAVMYRFGNAQFRSGFGASSERNFDKGSVNIVFEIMLNKNLWIVPSVSVEMEKGMSPLWVPGLSVKTSSGLFGS